jgi:Polyketide cyclase / dehydrase and lipid transport
MEPPENKISPEEGVDMRRIEGDIIINRPVDSVFDFVADERNEPCYNPRLRRAEQVSAGPIGLGTRFRVETMRWRRTVSMDIEFTAYDRPRRLASSTHLSAMDIHGTLTFEPVADATRMHWSWQLRPRGVFRLMTPIINRIGQRQERTIWASLKRCLEQQESTQAA